MPWRDGCKPPLTHGYVYDKRFVGNWQAITATQARANLYRLIDEVAQSYTPILISGKRSNAVLVSSEDWNAIQETLYLLAVPGMPESIKAGMAELLAQSATGLDWGLGRFMCKAA